MKTTPLSTFMDNMDFYIHEAKAGNVFVYPTDTIYGIWGIVDTQVITKITTIKQRPASKSYSIIAPSFQRISDHFIDCDDVYTTRTQLKNQSPDRGLTLLLQPKPEHTYIADMLSNNTYIWVRILDHALQSRVTALGQWFITTSANISGADPIYILDHLTHTQKTLIDYAIDEWRKEGTPSRIIYGDTMEVVRA